MKFLLVFAVTAAASVLFASSIKKHSAAFYVLALGIVAIYFAGMNGLLPGSWWKPTIALVQRCFVAFSIFSIVMFVGVLPKGSWLDARLRPIRTELSLIACILCLGHVCAYFSQYVTSTFSGALRPTTTMSVVVAFVVLGLLLVLGVTSIGVVKRKMSGRSWKSVQRLSYVFFGLVYIHLMLVLLPGAISESGPALSSMMIYSVVVLTYGILRIARAREDNRAFGNARASEAAQFEDEPVLVAIA